MNLKKGLVILLCCGLGGAVQSQTIIPVETKNNALVFQVDVNKNLVMIYLGHKLNDTKEYKDVSSAYKQALF